MPTLVANTGKYYNTVPEFDNASTLLIRIIRMDDALKIQIKTAVMSWAERIFDTKDIILGAVTQDEPDEEEGDRYLVEFAVRSIGYWLIAEVWVASYEILNINDLGEGLPLEDVTWPWPYDQSV